MDRIYMNRIEGQRRIHVEITSSEVSDLLEDLQPDPEHYDSTNAFLALLDAAEETFSPVVAEGRRDRAARTASGQQPETEPLRPRAERCPEPECTDEQQCWRCDYEESQHAARRPAPTPTCTSTHPARPTRCILPGRHAVPHTDGACQWPEHAPAVGQPAEAHATDEAELRRRYGQALRHWGLLDEVNDPKAAEEFAVTDIMHITRTTARAAVLREAADAIDARQAKLDAEIRAEYGELDRDTELEGAATRSMAARLRRMAEEARS